MTQDKIIDKINKLLALSKHNNSPEEAASAAAKVQALLEQYNLDRAAIEGQPNKTSMIMEKITLPTSRLWAKRLLNIIALFNYCKAVWDRGTDRSYLLGDPTNIEAVKILYEHLASALTAMLPVYYVEYCRSIFRLHERPLHINTYRTNFLDGANDALLYRLAQQRQQTTEDSRALTICNDAELKEFQKQTFAKVTNVDLPKRDGVGYQSGIKAGLIVDMSPHKLVQEVSQ